MGRKQAMEEQLQQAVDARASPALPTGSNIIIHVAKKSHAAKKPMRPGSIIIRPRRPSRGRASSCSQQLNVRPTPRTAMLDGDQAHVGTYARPRPGPSGQPCLAAARPHGQPYLMVVEFVFRRLTSNLHGLKPTVDDRSEQQKMIELLLAVSFSAAPLTLYLPPVRSLTIFVQAMEEMLRGTRTIITGRYYQRLRVVCVRIFSCVLPASSR
ncbi:hypothetical protein Dimus_034217 [Dionaea muscipula]